MENVDGCPDEGEKAGVLCRKLMRKVDEIWLKTNDIRRRVDIFYGKVLKPTTSVQEKKENSRSWKAEFDDFSERWYEIDEGKDEVDWLLINLHGAIEDEEERKKKTEKDMH